MEQHTLSFRKSKKAEAHTEKVLIITCHYSAEWRMETHPSNNARIALKTFVINNVTFRFDCPSGLMSFRSMLNYIDTISGFVTVFAFDVILIFFGQEKR